MDGKTKTHQEADGQSVDVLDEDREKVIGRIVEMVNVVPAKGQYSEREWAAATWLVDLDDKPLTDAQFNELSNWLGESHLNRREFLRILQSMRRTLILRRRELPMMYGTRSDPPDNPMLAKLRAIRGNGVQITDEHIAHALGGLLRQMRHARAWTVEMLSAAAGVDEHRVASLEDANTPASFAEVYRVAEGFEIPPNVFVKDLAAILNSTCRRRTRQSTEADAGHRH